MERNNFLSLAIEAAIAGGEEIMQVYNEDFNVDFKEDHSPLTEADRRANEVIVKRLIETDIPIISEENKQLPYSERKHWNRCWIVDPLDGTKEFIKRNGEFTVNIALVENGSPILGVVYVPVTRVLYFASEAGSYKAEIPASSKLVTNNILETATKLPAGKRPLTYTIVASRSHKSPQTEAFIAKAEEKYGKVELASMGSSLKLCLVAEGKAHVYPRLAPTMEWDTAAAHAVAKYAGCRVFQYDTEEDLIYNKENLLNPFFVVSYE